MSSLIKVNPRESLDQMSQTYIQNLDLFLELSSYVLILILFGILYKNKEGRKEQAIKSNGKRKKKSMRRRQKEGKKQERKMEREDEGTKQQVNKSE